MLGAIDAPKEEVENFYNFWYNFDSWRSFEYLDKEVNEGSDKYVLFAYGDFGLIKIHLLVAATRSAMRKRRTDRSVLVAKRMTTRACARL